LVKVISAVLAGAVTGFTSPTDGDFLSCAILLKEYKAKPMKSNFIFIIKKFYGNIFSRNRATK
jgi:hypothetical protein